MKPSLLDRIVATLFTKSPQSTTRQRVSRFLTGAALTTAFVVASFFAAPASAQYGLPSFTVGAGDGSTTVVGFGGKQWYVINDNSTTNPTGGSVRLLHKWDEAGNTAGAGGNFDLSTFRNWTGSEYEQPYVTNPNEYGGGTLQQYLEAQAGALSAGEQAVLIERSKASMTDLDQVGQNFADQKLWALSLAEWNAVAGDAQIYPSPAPNAGYFWLRSPYVLFVFAFFGGSGGGSAFNGVDHALGVRPASDLNLSSVIFTSTNDVSNGKSQAATGGGWYNYNPTPAQPARDIKFTFLNAYDSSTNTTGQKTPNLTLKSGYNFDFSGATTGTNQYVSGLLHGTGLTDYYAKFAETTSTESGSFNSPAVNTLGNGVYAFDIFCEQANGVNMSDFMGKPVQFELTVSGGAATDLTLVSTDIDFGLDGGTIGLKNGLDYQQTWTLGTSGTNTINTADNSTISGTMTGSGGFTKTGTGTLVLTGNNTATGDLNHETGTVDLRSKWSGDYQQAVGTTLITADGVSIGKAGGTSTFKGMVNPTGTLNIQGNAKFDGAEVDFGLLTAGNKIVVDGHADINSVTMRVDAANIIDSSSYILTEFDTVDTSGIHVISVKGLGDNRGGEYFNDTNTALMYDVIVGSTTLTWKGASNTWNDNDKTNRNWSTGNIDTYFKNGDSIIFADSATNKNVTVASAITVGTMDVSASGYTFNVDLDKGGSISATNFANAGNATVVATKNDATDLEKGQDNAKFFDVLSGNGADAFADGVQWSSTNSKIKYALFSDSDTLGYLLWLMNYADEYGNRLSRNGNRMAALIDVLPSDSGFLTRLDALTDDTLILSGIENATGEAYAASMDGTARLQRTFNDLLIARKTARRSSCDPCAPVCGNRKSYELWGTFTGGSHDRSSIGSHRGYDLSSYGVAFGIEREISNRWFGGVAFGYDNATQKLDDRFAKDEFEAFRASVYGGYAGRSWYASGYAGYSKNWHDLKRDNYALGFSNRGKYDDDIFSTGLEVGKVLKLRGGARFIPSVGVHWIHLDGPEFTERGDLASALQISSAQYDSVRLPVGARLNKTFTTSRDLWSRTITWTPEVRAFYVAELADTRAGLNTAFASSLGSGTAFADSGNGGRSGGQFGTGIMAQLTTRLSVGVDYDYEVWEHYDRHNLTGNVTVRW